MSNGLSSADDWRTRQRTKGRMLAEAWSEWLGLVAWQYFVTLTFDPKRKFGTDFATASKEAFWWCTQVGRVTSRPVGWLYAPERGRGGCHHVHALLAGVGQSLGPAPPAMWRQRNGNVDIQPVYAGQGVVLYTTKAAALTGEVSFSDTLGQYRAPAGISVPVALCSE